MSAEIEKDAKKQAVARNVAILTAGIPVTITFNVLLPVVHKIEEALVHNANDSLLVRLAITVIGFTMILGAPAVGYPYDRFGPRRPLMVLLTVWMVFGLLPMLAPSLSLLIACRAVQGFAAAGCLTIVLAMLGEVHDEILRAKLAGWYVAISSVVGLSTLLISGVLGEHGWTAPLFLHLFTPLLMLVVLQLAPGPSGRHAAVGQGSAAAVLRGVPLGLTALGVFAGIFTFAANTFMPYRFHEIGVDSTQLVSFAMAALQITVGAGAGIFGWVLRYLQPWTMFAISFVLVTVGASIAAFMTQYPSMIVALLVYGAGISWLAPNLFALVAGAVDAPVRGRVVGIVKGFNLAAAPIGALLLEPVMRRGGAAGTMMAVAIASAVGAFVMALVLQSGKLRRKRLQPQV
jgi:MFS family permease